MIKGIGIDAVELSRIKPIVEKQGSFIQRVLTPNELTLFEKLSTKRQIEFLAGRFACKEAFSKAWGTGIGKVGLQETGAPYVANSPHNGKVFVSITHTDTMAIAQIVLESE